MKNIWKYMLGFLVVVLILIWAEIVRSPEAADTTSLYFFNIGQGDAEMIEKGDYQILIDGGPDNKILERLGSAMPLTDRKIEAVILTHPHADHLAGLIQVLDRYQVEKIYLSGMVHTSNQYLDFLDQIKSKNVQTVVPEAGETLAPFADATLTFFWPGTKSKGQTSCDADNSDASIKYSGGDKECIDNLNNTSEVVRFCFFDECALYLGDLQNDGQSEMLEKLGNNEIKSQILKIAHHGSSNGTNEIMMDKVRPEYAVISVGADNKYGHPHTTILELLSNYKLPSGNSPKILRTDRDGTIHFTLSPSETILSR